MAFFYLNKNTPLYKGNYSLKRDVNRTQQKLFWLSRNSTKAEKYGNVSLYVPRRRLKLLKLNYGTVRQILKDPSVNTELKKYLSLSWGFNMQGQNRNYINQLENIGSINSSMVASLYTGKRQPMQIKYFRNIPDIWKNSTGTPLRTGRVSVKNLNVKTYELLKKHFSNLDGIYSPSLRSPFHKLFPEEIVIFDAFKPNNTKLEKSNYPMEKLVENFVKRNIKAKANNQLRAIRKAKQNTRINSPGKIFNSPRTSRSANTGNRG